MTNKYMKRYSTSLTIPEIQIKTTVSYHFTCTRMSIIKNTITNTGQDVKSLKSSTPCWREQKMLKPLWESLVVAQNVKSQNYQMTQQSHY